MSNPTRRTLENSTLRERSGPPDPRIDALLVELGRCTTPQERSRVGARLATSGVPDDRIRPALVAMLADDPMNASAYLSALGDPRSVPDLTAALDRLLEAPVGDCAICQAEHLVAILTAVKLLGGAPSDEQLAAVDAAMDRAADLWVPLEDHWSIRRLPPDPFGCARARRPGRNDPCPCGSGKKYKRCHLGTDRDADRGADH